MPNKFLELTGADPASILLAVNHPSPVYSNTGSGRIDNGVGRPRVRRVPLNMAKMREIREFFLGETALANALTILDGYSLDIGMVFRFATRELTDAQYGLSEPMRELLTVARQWYIMFGFVAIRNPDLRAARLLQQQREVDAAAAEAGANGDAAAALDEPFETVQTIVNLIDDVIASPAEARRTTERVLGNDAVVAALTSNPTAAPRLSNRRGSSRATFRCTRRSTRRAPSSFR